jgi:hypothetical protein
MEYLNELMKAITFSKEELNHSFNLKEINNPHKSFYTQKYVQLFKKEDLSSFKSKTELYISFSKFLSEQLNKDNLFLRNEKNVFEYFKNKAKHWALVCEEKNFSIEDRFIYIIKKFIIDSINGLITEETFYRKIKNIYKLNITKTTPEEDAKECVDFFIDLNGIKCGFQVKPKSFFYGIKKGTTQKSLKKIHTAFEQYKNPLFLLYIENKNIYFVIRDKNKVECNVINEDTFFKLLNVKLTKEMLCKICSETFNKISNKINYKK